MAKNHSYKQIAENFDLWGEYVDPQATMTQTEFDKLSVDKKIQMQKDLFGPDDYPPSQAATALRAIPSEKRSVAARENGKRGGRPRKVD